MVLDPPMVVSGTATRMGRFNDAFQSAWLKTFGVEMQPEANSNRLRPTGVPASIELGQNYLGNAIESNININRREELIRNKELVKSHV